jgi:hypothetical protein
MGCFNSTKNNKFLTVSDKLCQYPRTSKIHIKMRNITGNVISSHITNFIVTEPILINSKEITLNSEKFLISSCVLPGLDPRGEYKKTCQDNCFFLHDSESVLCCLFDGHGKEGEKVAAFCEKIITNLFTKDKQMLNVKNTQENPNLFMKTATETCDRELCKKSSGIESDYSGW